MKDLAQKIKDANREVYNNMSPEQYNQNESIFNDDRKSACTKILTEAAERSGYEKCLDIATGSGNLLRLEEKIFNNCFGIDIGENMLCSIKDDFPDIHLAAADAEALPFKNGSFNVISCYAMLHHLLTHEILFRECFRVLKNGGTLYTDHDPNYFLNRFYHIYYKLRYRNKPGFGSEIEELAEYHNAYSPGINPLELKKRLLEIGFSRIEIRYRITDKQHWSGVLKFLIPCLRGISKVIPAKSFFTHFSITAVK
jgi:ubiquinone/menaquinone biosynthesis C-methylase UbiE